MKLKYETVQDTIIRPMLDAVVAVGAPLLEPLFPHLAEVGHPHGQDVAHELMRSF